MILPWIAVIVAKMSHGLFTIEDPGRNTAKGDLTGLLIMPGGVLMLRAVYDIHLISWTKAILPSVAGGIVATAIIVTTFSGSRKRVGFIIGCLIFMTIYSLGVVLHTNRMLDGTKPDVFKVRILNKHHTTGKGATYNLTVTAWGPYQASNDIQVSRSLYFAKSENDFVCTSSYKGAYAIPWYRALPCEQ